MDYRNNCRTWIEGVIKVVTEFSCLLGHPVNKTLFYNMNKLIFYGKNTKYTSFSNFRERMRRWKVRFVEHVRYIDECDIISEFRIFSSSVLRTVFLQIGKCQIYNGTLKPFVCSPSTEMCVHKLIETRLNVLYLAAYSVCCAAVWCQHRAHRS